MTNSSSSPKRSKKGTTSLQKSEAEKTSADKLKKKAAADNPRGQAPKGSPAPKDSGKSARPARKPKRTAPSAPARRISISNSSAPGSPGSPAHSAGQKGEIPGSPDVQIRLGHYPCGDGHPLVIIAGLCVIETRDHTLWIAEQLKRMTELAGLPLIFKASYDKANRSSLESYRGPGAEKGLHILEEVREEIGLPILTDIHSAEEADSAGEVADVIQIPAFLCRQTDILLAAGKTGCAVNVKKGQFLAPDDMVNVARKILSTGNPNILLTERGTSFGYHTLVVDYRSLQVMRQKCRVPVCFDATHAVQEPGGLGRTTGGRREFVPPLARAAAAVGVDALFFEVHDNPALALSDGPNALDLDSFPRILEQVRRIDEMIRS